MRGGIPLFNAPKLHGLRWSYVAIALVLVASAGLRAYHVGNGSLWFDEVGSLETAMGHGQAHAMLPTDALLDPAPPLTDRRAAAPWREVWSSMVGPAGDVHPPLYFVLLRWWCDLFGYSDAAARSLSVVMSTAGVGLLFLIVRELQDEHTAVWAAAIMGVAQTQVVFAQEARNYATAQAFTLAAAYALVRIERRGWNARRCAALAVTGLAALLTHYFTLGAILALGGYAMLRLRGPSRRAVIGSLALTAVAFGAVWLAPLLRQIHGRDTVANFYADPGPGYALRWAWRLAQVPFGTLAEPLPASTTVAAGAAVLFALPALLVRRRPGLLLWALWIPGVAGLVAAVDWLGHTWLIALPRYTMGAGPGVYATLAMLPSLATRRPLLSRVLLPAGLVAALFAFIPGVYSEWHTQDNRRLAADVVALSHPGDVTVFYDARGAVFARQRYLTTAHYLDHMPGPLLILSGTPTATHDAAVLHDLAARDELEFVCNMMCSPDMVLPGARTLEVRALPSVGCVYRVTLRQSTVAQVRSK